MESDRNTYLHIHADRFKDMLIKRLIDGKIDRMIDIQKEKETQMDRWISK